VPARVDRIGDLDAFATAVAGFLLALQRIDATAGPAAGEHSFYRGGSLRHYDAETRRCLATVGGVIDVEHATAVWDAALEAHWDSSAVWFHGDVATGNLLVRDSRLSAVIDFGTCGVGDPACDLVLAWTFLSARSRETFRRAVGHDAGTWARARGWALWKSLLGLEHAVRSGGDVRADRHVAQEVLADHAEGARR
jgi:aminoglycoside phosphotransferase (APT) family kinase protein